MEPFSVRTEYREADYVRGLKQFWWYSWKIQLRRSGMNGLLVTLVIVGGAITLLLEARGLTPAINWRFSMVALGVTLAIYAGSAFNRRWRYVQSTIMMNRKFSHEENSGLLLLDDTWHSYRCDHYRRDNAWYSCRSWRIEQDVLTLTWSSGHVMILPMEFVGFEAFARIVGIVRTYAPATAEGAAHM